MYTCWDVIITAKGNEQSIPFCNSEEEAIECAQKMNEFYPGEVLAVRRESTVVWPR